MIGSITVVSGPMASGKTLELIRRLTRRQVANQATAMFKHFEDVRDGEDQSCSRIGLSINAMPINSEFNIVKYCVEHGIKAVGIEEAQFFDEKLVDQIYKLREMNIDVCLTGLNLTSKGEPFGIMPLLLALADDVVSLSAVCTVCKENASKTQRLVSGEVELMCEPDVIIDKTDALVEYQPRCNKCWETPRTE